MFKSVIRKFGKYYDKVEELPGFSDDLWTEVNKRLKQLDWLHDHISKRHSKCLELVFWEHRRVERLRKELKQTSGSLFLQKTRDSRKIDRLMFEIELYTESFYYLAGRMRTALRKGSLPGLRSFECPGARDVRNKLLEHPEGNDSRVFGQSFGVGGEEGPRLKVEREGDQEAVFPDAGLWANAKEIKDEFERLLDGVLSTEAAR
jgi:hypothetical protein